MSSGRGKGGRTGIAGNVNVALEKSDGTNTPLPADDEGLLIAKLFGEDNNGNDNAVSTDSKGRLTVKQSDSNRLIQGEDSGGSVQPVATDSAGRLKVKDVQFDGTVDIGDLQVMNTSEVKIDPATEQTLASIDGKVATESTLSTLASESTLSNIDGKVATESTVNAIETAVSNIESQGQNASGINNGSTSVGTSSSSIASSQTVPDDKTVTVQSIAGNSANVYIGDSSVTTGNGIEIKPGGQATGIEVDDPSIIHAVSNSGTQDLRWFYEG